MGSAVGVGVDGAGQPTGVGGSLPGVPGGAVGVGLGGAEQVAGAVGADGLEVASGLGDCDGGAFVGGWDVEDLVGGQFIGQGG